MRRPASSVLVLLVALGLVLSGCAGDDELAPITSDESEAPATDDDAAGGADDADDTDESDPEASGEDAEVASGILLQLRGQQVTASIDDSQFWSCSTSGDGGFATVSFLDEAGNDVSISYDEFGGTDVALTLVDGTTWNLAEDGVTNVVQDADGTYRMSLQVTESSSGETEAAEVRLSC